jgi:hypothetical protein
MGWLFGGGSSTTEVDIPDWLQESLEPLISGSTERYGDWQDALWDLGMHVDPETGLPRVLGDMSRGVADLDFWENRAGELAGGLSDGSPQYGHAANLWDQLSRLNEFEKETNYLSGIYADPRNSPYEHKRATTFLNQMADESRAPVTFEGYQDDPLFQQQMEAWEVNDAPVIDNAANAAGLGRFGVAPAAKGLSKTNATRDALQGYIRQGNINKDRAVSGLQGAAAGMAGQSDAIRRARSENLATKMGLGANLRSGRETAAAGYTGIGDRMHGRKMDAVNALFEAGGRRRGVNQERLDSNWEDLMRRAAAFETALGNPLGMIPGMTGATSTQQKKNK